MAIGNFDLTAAIPILKVRYTSKAIVESLVFASPVLGMLPKDTTGSGYTFNGPIRFATPNSRSVVPATAITSGGPSQYKQWVCPFYDEYVTANVTGGALDRSRDNLGAFVKAITSELDGAYTTFANILGQNLWNNSGGAIGKLDGSTTVTGLLQTLADPLTAINFQAGMILNNSATDGTSGSVRVGSVTLAKVNLVTGLLTTVANWDTGITSPQNTDYVFNQGDFAATFSKNPGIPAWIPASDPSSALFSGVDRTTDLTRLSGWRLNGGGAPKANTINRLALLMAKMGGSKPDVVAVCFQDYNDIVEDLGTRVMYTTGEAFKNPQISFPGISLATPRGPLKVVPDPYLPQGKFWILQLDTWSMVSIGGLPKIINFDGNDWLRAAADDAAQARLVARASLYCSAPGLNGCGTF